MLQLFFQEQVDENKNTLVLSVDVFIKSKWFLICYEIAAEFHTLVTERIKKSIGIGEYKMEDGERSWEGIKIKFEEILDLKNISMNGSSGIATLRGNCAQQIETSINRQLSDCAFYTNDLDDETEVKMKQAVLTNPGAESEFARFNNDCRRWGGQLKLRIMSEKHIIAQGTGYI